MKLFLALLLVVSATAGAVEVTVTGQGSTYDRALANAKMLALEQVTGTFVIGESEYKDNVFRDSMEEYNGGVIKSFRVKEHNRFNTHVEVTITADVVEKKDNRVEGKNGQPFNVEFEEFEQRRAVVDKLDNVNRMVAINVDKPTYEIDRLYSTVSIRVGMKVQPKWISDVQSFTSVIGEEGRTSNNTYANIHGGIVTSMIGSNPIAAVAVGVLGEQKQRANSEQTMVCFGTTRNTFLDCKNVGVSFVNIPTNPKLVVEVISDSVKYKVWEQELDVKMYEFVPAGGQRGHHFFKSYKKTFHQPTWIIYTDERDETILRFKLKNSIARNVQRVEVYLR